jgi:hypothetical protein
MHIEQDQGKECSITRDAAGSKNTRTERMHTYLGSGAHDNDEADHALGAAFTRYARQRCIGQARHLARARKE